MTIIIIISLFMTAAGIIIRRKAEDKDLKLAAAGLCFFGLIIMLTVAFFISYKYESPLSYIFFALTFIAAIALRIYAAFKTR